MAETTRLAKLPGYDTAPDVYETPELTDDTTTTANTSEEPVSEANSSEDDASDSVEDGPFGGISRRRLFPERARSRFQAIGNRVDAKGLDLSDRIDGRRKGLRVKRQDVVAPAADETLDARVARLRREVEECRALSQADPNLTNQDSQSDEKGSLATLSKALADLEHGERRPSHQANAQNRTAQTARNDRDGVEVTDEQTLSKVSIFDTRLTALEKALGISSLDLAPDGSFTAPILPSLNLLDHQMSALMASTSIAQIDAASSRIQKLARDAEQLAQASSATTTTAINNNEDGDEDETATTFSPEDVAKLNSLYSLLPTVQNLAPTVPALLERLRSLMALHSGAANAANELDQLEKRQVEMDAELKSWTEGLEKIEAVIKDASEANGRNGKVVQGWVKDLESRMAALG